MKNLTLKISILIVLLLTSFLIFSTMVNAENANERIILQKAENEYIVY